MRVLKGHPQFPTRVWNRPLREKLLEAARSGHLAEAFTSGRITGRATLADRTGYHPDTVEQTLRRLSRDRRWQGLVAKGSVPEGFMRAMFPRSGNPGNSEQAKARAAARRASLEAKAKIIEAAIIADPSLSIAEMRGHLGGLTKSQFFEVLRLVPEKTLRLRKPRAKVKRFASRFTREEVTVQKARVLEMRKAGVPDAEIVKVLNLTPKELEARHRALRKTHPKVYNERRLGANGPTVGEARDARAEYLRWVVNGRRGREPRPANITTKNWVTRRFKLREQIRRADAAGLRRIGTRYGFRLPTMLRLQLEFRETGRRRT
jgi:hypothetical protein